MTPPRRKRWVVPFFEAHETMYGVRVVERDKVSQEIQSVRCMFCAVFGREVDPSASRQRARTTRAKYWCGPTFRTDHYTSHLTTQHPLRWKEYQELSLEQKSTYFNAFQTLPRATGTKRKAQSDEQAASEQNSVYLQLSVGQEGKEDVAPLSAPASPEVEATSDADIPVAVESVPLDPVATVEAPVVEAVFSVCEALKKSHIEEEVMTFLLDRDVVDVVLSDVLFQNEDADDGAGEELVAFESTLDEWDTEDQQKSNGTTEVRAVVRSVRYQLEMLKNSTLYR